MRYLHLTTGHNEQCVNRTVTQINCTCT